MKAIMWSCEKCNKTGIVRINKSSSNLPFNSYHMEHEAYTEHEKLSPKCSEKLLTFTFKISVSPEIQKFLNGPLTQEQITFLETLLYSQT